MTAPKTERVNLRVAEADDTLFREAAALARESLSEFLVESARERAERVMADRNVFLLGDEEWRAFNAALDRPARVRPELAELVGRARPE